LKDNIKIISFLPLFTVIVVVLFFIVVIIVISVVVIVVIIVVSVVVIVLVIVSIWHLNTPPSEFQNVNKSYNSKLLLAKIIKIFCKNLFFYKKRDIIKNEKKFCE